MEGESEKASSDSWVVDIKKKLENTDPLQEKKRWEKPSIYRVPEWVMNLTHEEAYQPQVVSLGPFHHGERALRPMEEHKQRAVLHIVKRSKRPLEEFIAAIEKVADELLDAYDGLADEWRREKRGRFVEMMVADGCFLLEVMKGLAEKKAPADYASNDPIFSVHGMLYLWVGIQSDMVVIGNQLPLLALQRLEAVWRGTYPSAAEINRLVRDFLCQPLQKGIFLEGAGISDKHIDELCLHPLDVFHKSFCGRSDCQGTGQWEWSVPSAVELKEAGIQFKKSKTQNVCDVVFQNGVLSMPAVPVHNSIEKIFLNLMVFERLHSDAGSNATAYMIFMDNLIDSEKDVALLRSKGIIKNLLSSDKEAANMFNILSKGAVLSPSSKLHDVRRELNAHCKKPWNRWRAIFVHKYLNNPWVFMSLITATILLFATLLQTIYAVVDFHTKS
ncbi:UPF0481 protein At3g47200-like [Phragmites australis]|uniref:UPF0481 protein At3g47200-like n=1 Tax=Phragmites australis TaxID=29695 RepID=UPI002D79B4EE|nr:UPF0481 protein At3g47200-like [Phragmites australis]